jgi:VPDSG-CTERM motif
MASAFAVNAEAQFGPPGPPGFVPGPPGFVPGPPGPVSVPDSGSTLMLLGTALSALAFFRRRQVNR